MIHKKWNLPLELINKCSEYRLVELSQTELLESIEKDSLYFNGTPYKIVWQNESYAAYKNPHHFESVQPFIISLRVLEDKKVALIQRKRPEKVEIITHD